MLFMTVYCFEISDIATSFNIQGLGLNMMHCSYSMTDIKTRMCVDFWCLIVHKLTQKTPKMQYIFCRKTISSGALQFKILGSQNKGRNIDCRSILFRNCLFCVCVIALCYFGFRSFDYVRTWQSLCNKHGVRTNISLCGALMIWPFVWSWTYPMQFNPETNGQH